MKSEIKIFDSPQILADEFAKEFAGIAEDIAKEKETVNIALSGGSTPKLFFETLAADYKEIIAWEKIQFFWVDERCVPPGDVESNFGMTKKYLLDKINIADANIHRIKGEDDPDAEAKRYSDEVSSLVPEERTFPRFDMIILGMGADGHTASLFPGVIEPNPVNEKYIVTAHPLTGQKRISMTEPLINNSKLIYFLVTGSDKAKAVSGIINSYPEAAGYPAFQIQPLYGKLSWFLDKNAASLLK